MNKKEQLAYLTGIIDGEGHFYVPNVKNGRGVSYPTPTLLFVQSKKNNGLLLCQWAKNNFGGSVSYQKSNNMYRWELRGKKALELSKQIKPYLIVKQKQIERFNYYTIHKNNKQ